MTAFSLPLQINYTNKNVLSAAMIVAGWDAEGGGQASALAPILQTAGHCMPPAGLHALRKSQRGEGMSMLQCKSGMHPCAGVWRAHQRHTGARALDD
jgi:hypothetical protein